MTKGILVAFTALLFVVSTEGLAARLGEACVVASAAACDAGLVCDVQAGACGTAQARGSCVPVLSTCPDHRLPVCGCDGKTYPSNCHRMQAGVTKNHEGVCR